MFPFILNTKIYEMKVVIPSFFFMVMLGVLATTFFLYYRAPKLGLSQVACLDFGIIGAIFGVLGARLYHVFFENLDLGYHVPLIQRWFGTKPWEIPTLTYYAHDPMRILEFWRGGFVSYGAFIGGATAVIIYLKLRKLPILQYADFVSTAIPLMVIFIRLGCIGAGCCYGKPTDFFIHLIFHHPQSDAGSKFPGMALHASQIYDMLNGFILLGFLNWRYPRKRFHGEIFLLLFMGYSFFRFWIEFLRGDLDRGVWLGGRLSSAQITGLMIIAITAVCYAFLRTRAKTPPQGLSGSSSAKFT